MDKIELVLKRFAKKEEYTIGHLFVNGTPFCDTLEKTDRGLDQSMSLDELMKKKVPGKTAIPTGTYRITMNHKSPKFSKKEYYRDFCGGYMPRLLRVTGRKQQRVACWLGKTPALAGSPNLKGLGRG